MELHARYGGEALLAYSSIAHLGHLLIGLLVAAAPGGDIGLGDELVADPGPHPDIAWEGVAVVVAPGAAVLALGIQPSPLIALLPTLPS